MPIRDGNAVGRNHYPLVPNVPQVEESITGRMNLPIYPSPPLSLSPPTPLSKLLFFFQIPKIGWVKGRGRGVKGVKTGTMTLETIINDSDCGVLNGVVSIIAVGAATSYPFRPFPSINFNQNSSQNNRLDIKPPPSPTTTTRYPVRRHSQPNSIKFK